MQHNIILPDLGQTTSEAKIVQWLKKPGDYISRGEPLVAVETDKVDMEVEAFESGYLRELLAEEGSVASALAPVAILTDMPEEDYDRPGERKTEPAAPLAQALAQAVAQALAPPTNPPRGSAAPAARALARELGVDLTLVVGTGPRGLITRADVQRFVETGRNRAQSAMAAMAVTAANSKRDIPHFYATRDLELTSAVQWRDRWNATKNGTHASFNDVFVWCAAHALADVPRLNLAFRDGAFEQRSAADVLLVVAREPALLLVPVADSRTLDWKEFIHRMHDSGGQGNSTPAAPLLAISNLGMYGVKEFAAIIPPGCSSVLAIGAVREAPVVRNGALTVERIATVTLSADHRVIDGIAAARFLERMQFHLNSL
jgi:pyruvate dehydrogenase E2 component (dihydrolipoamide acetyltransferase)